MLEAKRILVVVSLFLAIFSFAGCSKKSEAKSDKEKEETHSEIIKLSDKSIGEIGLKTETLTSQPFKGYLTLPAKVITNQDNEAQVGSLVQGRVHKVFVRVGDFVKPGQALMQVEGLEIGEIKAGFLTSKANLDFKKANYERQKLLLEQNVGSRKSLLEAQSEYEKALAEFNAEDKKIHSIGLTDNEVLNGKGSHSDEHTSGTLTIKAPIAGYVVERNVVIGQLVDGTTNAFRIINTNSVWVDGQLNEKDASKLTEKTNVIFTSTAFPDKKFNGKLSYIGKVVDEKSRTITVRAEFNNVNNSLKPQMFGELKIPAAKDASMLMIPSEALVKFDNIDYLFIQKKPNTFEKRQVVIGSSQDEMTEIKDGVKEGENVVIKGAFYLKSELLKSELEED
ncbi:MAG: efflux RND transporter periplasmic adaptor subunit [Bacteroidota bacterium]|nr:efflux RND transporter periplasmic adaptor subunit [Bacteroidota bacterium]